MLGGVYRYYTYRISEKVIHYIIMLIIHPEQNWQYDSNDVKRTKDLMKSA